MNKKKIGALCLSTRLAPSLSLAWTFVYLLFFRLVPLIGLPKPTPFANAIQLLLTLKVPYTVPFSTAAVTRHCIWHVALPLCQMVSLANEVQSFHTERQKDVTSFTKSSVVGGLSEEPSFYGVLSYSYCYIGIMTGESVAPPPDAALPLCLSFISVPLLFVFAWNLTAVSLCFTLLHLSDTVWVHIVFGRICSCTCFCKQKLSPSPISCETSITHLPFYWSICRLWFSCFLPIDVFPTHLCLILPSTPKVPFFDSKHSLTGWGSRTHRCCRAGSRACSDWNWCLSTAFCTLPSTASFPCLTFAPRTSWRKTSFSGAG